MSTLGRDPILRGEMQSDMEGGDFNIVNVNAVGNVQQATLHVDPSLPEEIGERATGLPFKTLAAAVTAAEPGDVIQLRPGIHAYDGSVSIVSLDDLRIIGYGAIIKSRSLVNENTKISVQSARVTIEGIEFDGAVTEARTDSSTGCISVSASGCMIRNCYIHDQNATGVRINTGYGNCQILDSHIANCSGGIRAVETGLTANVSNIFINHNSIHGNRQQGILILGSGVESDYLLTRIEINDNVLTSNNTIASTFASIHVQDACQEIRIHHNSSHYEYAALYLNKINYAAISNNDIRGATAYGIRLVGALNLTITDNIIDGRDISETPVTISPLHATGEYSAPNDSANFVITGNRFGFLPTNSVAVTISNATGIVLNSNLFGGPITLTDVFRVQVQTNQILSAAISEGILINTSDRGCNGISITANRFLFFGASIARAITTADTGAFGITDLAIIANSTDPTETFGTATYGHSGSNAPTRVVISENTPESTVVTTGWHNAGSNTSLNTLFVSQSQGLSNLTALPYSRTNKFRTINYAIDQAVSGDTVVVEDGTFDELIDAKDGITLRFLTAARLACTTAAGCIQTTADNQSFYVYHEHTPITCSTADSAGITLTNSGAYIRLYGDLEVTGTGSTSWGVNAVDGQIEIWGHVHSTYSNAIRTGTTGGNNGVVMMHGNNGPTVYDLLSTTTLAISSQYGTLVLNNCRIQGAGTVAVGINSSAHSSKFLNCLIYGSGASTIPVEIQGDDTGTVAFRDCSLYAGASSSHSIYAAAAQTVLITGTLNANKGPEPPTNVTFDGPGTYNVDAQMALL